MADEDHGSAPVSRRIWLVRHGQTEANAEQRFCGWGESALTREGMEQARWLASYLSKRPLCALYSSDLRRALATAGAIAEAQQLPLAVRAMAAWREVDFGAWEGLTYAEIAARFPDRLDFFTAPAHYAPPGGESLTHLQQRVLTGLAHVLAECARAEGEIAIVSHGGPLRLLLCDILGMPLERQWQLALEPGSLSALDVATDQDQAEPPGRLALLNLQGCLISTDKEDER